MLAIKLTESIRMTLIGLAALIVFVCFDNNADADEKFGLPPIHWTLYANNSVLKPGQLNPAGDAKRISCCSVLQLDDKLRMYYWTEDENGYCSIGSAESSVKDPNNWKPLGIVLRRQADKPHNSRGPCFAYVVPRTDGPWLMYVCTYGEKTNEIPWATYVAVSRDAGQTWQYHGDQPVLPLTRTWNSSGTGSVSVIREGRKWRIYYSSFGKSYLAPKGAKGLESNKLRKIGIGYAESDDGIHWKYPLDRLVVEPRGFSTEPYEWLLSKPMVIKDGAGYRMWVSARGARYRLRALTSRDGLNWEWEADNLLTRGGLGGVGKPGSFDSIQRSYPAVTKHGDEYRLWYTGNGHGHLGQTNDGLTGLGYATGLLAK